MERRRIFANTIKYVLMGTSSHFGNMFSAATASVVLSFLPMLPGQILLFVFDAVPGEFRAGRFIESIGTQTLIIFAIRTRRVPFFRSRPSVGLACASLGVVALGIFLPLSLLAAVLGFDPRPGAASMAQNRAQRPSSGQGVRRIVGGSGHEVHSRSAARNAACGVQHALLTRPLADFPTGKPRQ